MFERIHQILGRISQWAVWVAGAALLVAAVIVSVDVIFRKFVGITMSGSDEISGYVFAAGTTWSYSYCLLHRANVRIDAVYNLLPRWPKAIFDVFGVFLLLLYMSLLTERAIFTLSESIEYQSVSITTLTTPLWIPQSLWVAGLILFMVTLLVVFAYSLTALLRREGKLVMKPSYGGGGKGVALRAEEQRGGFSINRK